MVFALQIGCRRGDHNMSFQFLHATENISQFLDMDFFERADSFLDVPTQSMVDTSVTRLSTS